ASLHRQKIKPVHNNVGWLHGIRGLFGGSGSQCLRVSVHCRRIVPPTGWHIVPSSDERTDLCLLSQCSALRGLLRLEYHRPSLETAANVIRPFPASGRPPVVLYNTQAISWPFVVASIQMPNAEPDPELFPVRLS